jgi:RNA polymerase sigma-70 factor (ECF subfamily)
VRAALATLPDPPGRVEEDAVLVERFVAGEKRAFDELVRRHQRAVFYLALRYTSNDADAKDLTQRTFVRAFQGLGRLRGEATFRTWLFRIAMNLAKNHLRDHARMVPMEEVPLPHVDAVGIEGLSLDATRRRLRDGLDRLPTKQRLVVELRVYEEMSFAEVARVAGGSENAAKVNFHYALKRLRALFARGEKP